MRLLIVIGLFCSAHALGQQDTVQLIEEMSVSIAHPMEFDSLALTRETRNVLSQEDIQRLQATDIGDLLRKMVGANLKSYGGLGGLKTVSMRGLGSSHTNISVDGFSLQNGQTGQVNLGSLQADNAVSIVSNKSSLLYADLPISTQVTGSAIAIQTFENSFSTDTFNLRARFNYGSYQRKDMYLAGKCRPVRALMLSAFGGLRSAAGKYNFRYTNGTSVIEDQRANNDYIDINYGATVGLELKNTTVRLGYRHKGIDQGLPGAVILYNQTSDERLRTDQHVAFTDVAVTKKKLSFRWHANGDLHSLKYSDPNFLNGTGGLSITYNNRNLSSGIAASYRHKRLRFFGGTEEIYSDLHVDDSSFAKPVRWHNYSLLGIKFTHKLVIATAQLSSQYVQERNANGAGAKDRFRLNPSATISTPEGKYRIVHSVWYKNSFRMPTFNELYYNSVGNKDLLPEDAHQFNYGFSFAPIERKVDVFWRSNVFINLIDNRIVAIPTQNLFVWSMQNIGKSRVYGLEAMLDVNWTIGKHWKTSLLLNYSYQRTLDYSDKDSPTYRHQLAYIPVHTGNLDWTIRFRHTGIRLSDYTVSKRYALNENIPTNEVNGFWITDLGLFHTVKLGSKNAIDIQFTVKNVFDKSYAFIRSFVMPGRNYLISITYAFN